MTERYSLQWVLERISRTLPEFGPQHLRFGLTLARCVVEGITTVDGRALPGLGQREPGTLHDLTADVAWIFWLDDCFDTQPDQSSDKMICITDLDAPDDESPIEAWSATKVREYLLVGERSDADWELWTSSAVAMTCAFQRNKQRSRENNPFSYEEYLDNGEHSSGVPHFMATVSLVYGLDLATKLSNPIYARLIRNLSLEMRLENDLVSLDKELDEGDCSNSVIVMSAVMDPRAATAFIEAQRAAFERKVLEDVALLGDDPIARAVELVMEAAHVFHNQERSRYSNVYELARATAATQQASVA